MTKFCDDTMISTITMRHVLTIFAILSNVNSLQLVRNEREHGAEASLYGPAISRYTIVVGAVGKRGKHSSYSNPGCNLLVSAPGGDNEFMPRGIQTFGAKAEVAGGGCSGIGSGTSFATPIVSAVVALMLEAAEKANKNVSWRDVHAIIAKTSTRMEPEVSSGTKNGAGLYHSNLYGFGVINACKAVAAAETWKHLGLEKKLTATVIANAQIPIDGTPLVSKMKVEGHEHFRIESVYLFVKVAHGTRGDLDVRLTSPQGTESVLAQGQRPETTETSGEWQFRTLVNYFEPGHGEWKLTITDDHRQETVKEVCADLEWSVPMNQVFGNGSPDPFDCGGVAGQRYCKDGNIEDVDILNRTPYFADSKKVQPADACCVCGGGRKVLQELLSWRLEIFWHWEKEIDSPAPINSDSPNTDSEGGRRKIRQLQQFLVALILIPMGRGRILKSIHQPQQILIAQILIPRGRLKVLTVTGMSGFKTKILIAIWIWMLVARTNTIWIWTSLVTLPTMMARMALKGRGSRSKTGAFPLVLQSMLRDVSRMITANKAFSKIDVVLR